MTKKYWNDMCDKLDKVARIYVGPGQNYFLDGTYPELQADFSLKADLEKEELSISYVHPHTLDYEVYKKTGKTEFIDLPETVVFKRKEIQRVEYVKDITRQGTNIQG